ncbi:TPA: phage minor tail protein L [Escherichia coli]|nr:phage minor tail protein L [Escherichia coli]EIS5228770.1 phage minor tail protein L [Escherichia coli]EKG4439468.1 phage minor tail protein L [Escherichia coli]EKK0304640.1 phage minor tail protein L [Escherichia coli]EKP2326465.1 phage minor tail protein L [Escherichia coli]
MAALSGVHRQTAAARLQNLPVAGGHECNLKLYRVVDIVSAFLALPPPVAEGEMDAHERKAWYARFLDAVNFVNGNSDADPEQEVISRWRIEQCSELSAVSASFVLSTPTETDGAVFPGRIMLANTCTWTYRGDECGYHGPAVADEYDQPTSDITKDKCSKCLNGCKFRNNVGNFGGFLSINKLSQ